jgi:hypothetical protein
MCNEPKYKAVIHVYIFHKHTEARTTNYKSSLYKKLTQNEVQEDGQHM